MLHTTTLRKVLLIGLLTLLIASQAGSVSAGINVWTSNGPADAIVHVLAIDPMTPTTLYAGADMGVFKSTDGGGNWSPAGLTYLDGVYALVIDPKTPATLYAGGKANINGGGVYKSTNGGGNWAKTYSGGWSIYALAIDPVTPTTLYAGTYWSGVIKSTDGGEYWKQTGLTYITNVYALAIDPVTPTILYAGTDTRGVFKTTDGGKNWSATGLTTYYVEALAIDPQTPATLYAGTYIGVFKSTDGGGNWSAAGLTNTYVESLAIDPATPSTLYAGTNGGGVFKSTDSGGNWSAFNTGLTNTYVHALAIDPVTPTILYAGTGYAGIGGGVFAIQQIDTTPPTVVMTSLAPDPTHASPIAVSVTFSENVTGFTSTDIVPANGSVSNFAGGGANYTFDLTPTEEGLVTANIAAGVATDSAGNGNTVAMQFSRTYEAYHIVYLPLIAK